MRFIRSSELVEGAEVEDLAQVERYLRSSPIILRSPMKVLDPRSHSETPSIPVAYYTDGSFVWAHRITHAVHEYGLAPPAEFIEHVRANGYEPPPVSSAQLKAARTALTESHD